MTMAHHPPHRSAGADHGHPADQTPTGQARTGQAHASHAHDSDAGRTGHPQPYWRLAAMTLLSFASMYVLMYAMVDRPSNVYNNVNQAFMAALMAAPMVLIELALMGVMYPRRGVNVAIAATAAVVLVAAFVAIRWQTAVGDRQFLRSMIPHHAGAILMCENADLADRRLRDLCGEIITSQRREIAQMKGLLGD